MKKEEILMRLAHDEKLNIPVISLGQPNRLNLRFVLARKVSSSSFVVTIIKYM